MRILFVDDDAMNRRVVRDMLKVAGVDMDEAPEAQSGLEMIERDKYDLVLMDLRMPGMDGLTAIRTIRARRDEKARVPIIVVTADGASGIKERCVADGADDLLTKPVAMKLLFKMIGEQMAAVSSARAASGSPPSQ